MLIYILFIKKINLIDRDFTVLYCEWNTDTNQIYSGKFGKSMEKVHKT
jgi:hypothetical protein